MLIHNRFGKDHLFSQAEGGYLSNPLRACPGPGVLLVVLAACHMEIPETVQDLLAKPGDFLVGYSLTEARIFGVSIATDESKNYHQLLQLQAAVSTA